MDPEEDKQKRRTARNNFLNHILKRPNSKPRSIRYEDTSAEPVRTSSNKRFKLKGPTMDSEGAQLPKTPLLIDFYDPAVKGKDAKGRTLHSILAWEDMRLERCHDYIQMLFPLPEGSPFNIEAPIIDREVLEAFRSRSELRVRLRQSFERILQFYGFVLQKEYEGEGADDVQETGVGLEHVEQPMQEEQAMDGVQGEPDREAEQGGQPNNQGSAAVQDSTPNGISEGIPDGTQATTTAIESTLQDPASTPEDAPEIRNDSQSSKPAASNQATDKNVIEKTLKEPVACKIDFAPHWREAARNWVLPFDHNHLRITRILRSLRVLGLQKECEAFYAVLKDVYTHSSINDRTMMYWRNAFKAPLHMAPDGEKVYWLKKWVEGQEDAKSHAKPEEDSQAKAEPSKSGWKAGGKAVRDEDQVGASASDYANGKIDS